MMWYPSRRAGKRIHLTFHLQAVRKQRPDADREEDQTGRQTDSRQTHRQDKQTDGQTEKKRDNFADLAVFTAAHRYINDRDVYRVAIFP